MNSMNIRTLSLLAFAASVALPGCQRKTAGIDAASGTPTSSPVAGFKVHEPNRLGAAVDAYAQLQNPENDLAVRTAMADVDNEIAELEDLLAKRHGRDREKVAKKMKHLQISRSQETTRFAEIQSGTSLTPPAPPARPDAGKMENGVTHAGNAPGDAAGDVVR